MNAIYEVAIQAVKPSEASSYPEARRAFLQRLQAQPGVERDWTLESFFTMPEPDTSRVLVGLTRWRSLEDFQAASAALASTAEAEALFSRVDMRAFVQARPADAQPFLLEEVFAGPEQVLEVAVRRLRPGVSEAAFQAARQRFFACIAAQPGYAFDRELIDDAGNRIVLIGWQSTEAFMSALSALQQREELGSFFALLDVQAYQAARLI